MGDIFSSLGTTLVTRILTDQLIRDPQGRAYCQIFPGNEPIYLPGGASSVGAGCLTQYFPGIDYTIYDARSVEISPNILFSLSASQTRRAFSIRKTRCGILFEGTPVDDYERYAAFLQGVAFVERLCVETLEELGAISGNHLFTVGGGSSSEIWLQLRVDVLNKILIRPQINEAAFGAGNCSRRSDLNLRIISQMLLREWYIRMSRSYPMLTSSTIGNYLSAILRNNSK